MKDKIYSEDLISKIVKVHNKIVFTGGDLSKLSVQKIPSGVFTFDYFTGGGIPVGRFTQFHGARSSGKTTFTYKLMSSFLKLNPELKVLFVDFEHSFDYNWAKEFIADIDRVILISPDYGEQGIDFINEFAKALDIGLIVVDSIGSMIPATEVSSTATDDFVGLHAKMVNKLLRRLIVAMSDRRKIGQPLTVLFINQVRANIGVRSFQPQTSVTGGKMLEHLLSMDIKFYIKNYEKSKDIPFRCTIGFKIEKNKVGLPSVGGEFKMYINNTKEHRIGDVLEDDFIFETAKKTGLITRQKGKWLYKDLEFENQVALMQQIEHNLALKEALKSDLLASYISRCEVDDADEVVEDNA